MTIDIKVLAKQAGTPDYIFTPYEMNEFVRLVREDVLSEARQAIEMANADRHIDLSDCVQIIEEMK